MLVAHSSEGAVGPMRLATQESALLTAHSTADNHAVVLSHRKSALRKQQMEKLRHAAHLLADLRRFAVIRQKLITLNVFLAVSKPAGLRLNAACA